MQGKRLLVDGQPLSSGLCFPRFAALCSRVCKRTPPGGEILPRSKVLRQLLLTTLLLQSFARICTSPLGDAGTMRTSRVRVVISCQSHILESGESRERSTSPSPLTSHKKKPKRLAMMCECGYIMMQGLTCRI
jgi:hypothetical protein